MIVRFNDFISASLYASEKRQEGYYAEVMHMQAGHFWGDIASKGFPVIVSDCAREEGDDEPPEIDATFKPFQCLGWLLFLFVRVVAVLLALWITWLLLQLLYYRPQTVVVLGIYALLSYSFYLILMSYSLCLLRMNEIYRDKNHHLHLALRFFYIILAVALALLQLL